MEREPVPGWDVNAVAKLPRWAVVLGCAIGSLILPSPFGLIMAVVTLILIGSWVRSRLGW